MWAPAERHGPAPVDGHLAGVGSHTYPVRTGAVMKTNVTISAEEDDVRRARDVARRQGTTLNAMLRRYLRTLAGRGGGERASEELMTLFRTKGGNSKGRKPRREDAYEGRA